MEQDHTNSRTSENEGAKKQLPGRLTLPKSSRLRHRSLVEGAFAHGASVYAYPLRATVRALSDDELKANFKDHVPDRIGPVQMMITVPKKKRKHAVDRVLMRRRIREAFRLNRMPLHRSVQMSDSVRTLSVALIYIADKNEEYAVVEKGIRKILRKLGERYAQ